MLWLKFWCWKLAIPDTVLVPRACCCHAAGVMYFRYSSQTLKVRVHT